jgi:predicted ATPase
MIAAGPTARFRELTVKGFRRLRDVRLELRPLSVMIGANGTGKTSVLDVLSLLANSAQGRLSASISALSGLASILTYDRAEELEFGITSEGTGQEALEYKLSLGLRALGYVILGETLIQERKPRGSLAHVDSNGASIRYFDPGRKKLTAPNWEPNPQETSLAQVPKNFQVPEEFRRRLESFTFYHVLEVDRLSPIRLPQPMRPAELPGRNGEDLVSCLYYLRETNRDRFDAIEDSLRAAYPRFERLDFPPVAAGTLSLAWRERGFSKPLYAHQLSEGTLRYLWLTALLQSPGLPALTLIDEPEVSLHPALISLLAEQLREASHRTQVVVATHSDTLIRFLEPREVVVLDSNESGMTDLTWADDLGLDGWLKDFSLDELWRNGRLGARI